VNPGTRRKVAAVHLVLSLVGMVAFTVFVAHDPFERVLMAISWYAITITSADVLATTDVRASGDDG
jgi:hypothetical protein